MPVPTSIDDLSQTAGSNYPGGGESPSTADDYFRAHASFLALLRDGKGFSDSVQLVSAATTDIGGQNSMFVEITGTTTITSFGTNYNGPRFLRFTGALTLTHNATTLNLPGAANITTAAGDCAIAVPNQAGNGWNVSQFERADGRVLIGALTSGTAVSSTSGTAIDFTGIPSWAKRVTVMFFAVSTTGTSAPLIQIGDSGGIETTNYFGASGGGANGDSLGVINYSTGFGVAVGAPANVVQGSIVIEQVVGSSNTWVARGVFTLSNGPTFVVTSGSKQLSGTLDRVRITTLSGVDTFDNGSVNILYE